MRIFKALPLVTFVHYNYILNYHRSKKLNYILIFLLAILTSTASALVGLGGGLLLIPLIILIFDLPMKFVAGTMLIAMVPYTLIATLRNLKQGYVNFRIGLVMETGSVLGVIIGSHLSVFIPDLLLKFFFLVIVIYLMLSLQIPSDSPYNYVARLYKSLNHIPPFFTCKATPENHFSASALIFIGLLAGTFSGMLGIGGGFLKTPVLIVGIMLPPKVAVGTALFMILITASVGAINHALLGHINYTIALIITLGMMIGAYFGTGILKSQPEQRIKKFILAAMFIAAISTLFR